MTTIPNTAGDDTLVGTDSNDTFPGGDGSDLILARDGDDTITVSGKSGSWGDTLDGGAGTDRVIIDLEGVDSLLDFSRSAYTEDTETFTLTDGDGHSIRLTSIEEIEIGGAVFSTQVQEHEGHLIDLENAVYIGMNIPSDEGKGVFYTDDVAPMGSDLIYPTAPRDAEGNTIRGFTLYGTDLDDIFQTVQLGDGDSYVETFAGDDYLEGGRGSDTLIGGTGNDHFRVDDGGDLIRGGEGDDTVWLYVGDVAGNLADNFIELDGGPGTDSLTITFRTYNGAAFKHISLNDPFISSFENISVNANGGPFSSVRGNSLDNVITVGGDSSTFFIHGGDGNDTITSQGYHMNVTLMGGAGDDDLGNSERDGVLWGGDGNDNIHSHADGTTLGGGAGDDTLDGDFSHNTFYGGAGDDVIKAGSGSDLIFGGAGNDIITTSYGFDSIWGGAGDDQIDLGPSDEVTIDHLWFSTGHGNDVITGFNGEDDILHLGGTEAEFTTVTAVKGASQETSVGGQSGILIDTGGGNSIFVEGLTIADLTAGNIAFD
ncbi:MULTISPECIES: calcium-binding protein [Kordiimonas]|jgi:Ca2+-binding RTX toxin-like protein|uniref:calcium-binding protein n=1 Tax=Kordiimonas TaxID=288021 RepID=UPI00257B4699|nr:calcium-binding protein [Kordiimonas sp. UBA4487]